MVSEALQAVWDHLDGQRDEHLQLLVDYVRRPSSARRVEGRNPLLVPAMGGSLPDYVFTKVLGIPSLGVPLGNLDEANHAPNENLELRRFFNGIKTAAAILDELAATTAP